MLHKARCDLLKIPSHPVNFYQKVNLISAYYRKRRFIKKSVKKGSAGSFQNILRVYLTTSRITKVSVKMETPCIVCIVFVMIFIIRF